MPEEHYDNMGPYESDLAHFNERMTFNDWLLEELRRTPYFFISTCCMALFLLITFLIRWETGVDKDKTIQAALSEKKDQKLIPPEEEALDDTPIHDDRKVKDPKIRDAEPADHNETDNDEEFEKCKGDSEDFLSDKPFKDTGAFDSLGIGGGAGGAFGGRFGGKRNLVARGGGGGTQKSVIAGLRWLKNHQDKDGRWDAANFSKHCKEGDKCEGTGGEHFNVGVTGLALLAFLGAGYTHRIKDQYGFYKVVKNGLRYLRYVQTEDGCFGPQTSKFMYNHCIAGLAMAEAYALTRSPLFRKSAEKGIDFILKAQNPGLAWRYTVQPGDNDTSVTGWAVMALKSARVAGIKIPDSAFEGARAFVESMTEETYYKGGYTAKGSGDAVVRGKNDDFISGEAMTAVCVLCRIFMIQTAQDRREQWPAIRGGIMLMVEETKLPKYDVANKTIDYYYWYYGTLAMFQADGPKGSEWKKWNIAMKGAIVNSQKRSGCQKGSWDTVGKWCFEGGRVYSTAINVLSLEVYYRYANVFGVGKKYGKK